MKSRLLLSLLLVLFGGSLQAHDPAFNKAVYMPRGKGIEGVVTFPRNEMIFIRAPLVSDPDLGHRKYLLIQDVDQVKLMQRFLDVGDDEYVLGAPRPPEAISQSSKIVYYGIQALLLLGILLCFLGGAILLFWLTRRYGIVAERWLGGFQFSR